MHGLYTTNTDIKGTSCTSVVSTLCDDLTTDVEQVVLEQSNTRKLLIHGALYIVLEDGRIFDVQGKQVW